LFYFVILISALTMSVSVPEGIPEIKQSGELYVKPTTMPFYSNIHLKIRDILMGVFDITKEFIENGITYYKFESGQNSFYLTSTGLLYKDANKTNVFGVKFEFWRDDLSDKSFRSTTQKEDTEKELKEKQEREKQIREAADKAEITKRIEIAATIKSESGHNVSINDAEVTKRLIQLREAAQREALLRSQPLYPQPRSTLGGSRRMYKKRKYTRRMKGGVKYIKTSSGIIRKEENNYSLKANEENVPKNNYDIYVASQSPAQQGSPPGSPPGSPLGSTSQGSQPQGSQAARQEEVRKEKEDYEYFKIILTNISTEPRGPSVSYVFDKTGKLYDEQSLAQSTTPFGVGYLKPKIEGQFSKESAESQVSTTQDYIGKKPAFELKNKEQVVKDLKTLFGIPTDEKKLEELSPLADIFSPAALRAILLSTQVPAEFRNAILTKFCGDPWNRTSLASTPAYAFLEALFEYSPIPDGQTTDSGSLGKNTFLLAMTNNGFVKKDPSSSDFKNVTFSQYESDVLYAFCKKQSQHIEQANQKQVLTNSHKMLQQAYETHLQNIFTFLKTLFIADRDFVDALQMKTYRGNKPILRIHPYFTEHPRGSLIALEEKIKEARQLLSKHYLEVETIYSQALKSLSSIMSGEQPSQSSLRTQ
jgi:hypothetical protein